MRIDERPSAPMLAGIALGAMMVMALLAGLAIGRAATQGLQPAGAISPAGPAGSFCQDGR